MRVEWIGAIATGVGLAAVIGVALGGSGDRPKPDFCATRPHLIVEARGAPDDDVILNPYQLAVADFLEREHAAWWAWSCVAERRPVKVRHGKTGRVIATYSTDDGYETVGED